MRCPFYGCRKFAAILDIDKDHANRLMRKMGIEAIYRKPRITVSNADHEVHPYLLRGVTITQPNHVWSTDIIYIPMAKGFVYLVAVIDWCSRFVLSRQVSNTLDKRFCIEVLQEALSVVSNRRFSIQISTSSSANLTYSGKVAKQMKGEDGNPILMLNVFAQKIKLYLTSYSVHGDKTNEPGCLKQHLEELFNMYPTMQILTGDAAKFCLMRHAIIFVRLGVKQSRSNFRI